ncbi:MAG TPA: response regulator [Thermoanaerobaculia bacterium]|nr:response regulator [Thermoanaerobaculia bacterium]
MSRLENPPVLLVDDSEETCTLIRAVLRHDFSVEICSTGLEAIENLRTRRYAAILLDLKMPDGNGFDVLDYLRDHAQELLPRVIIVTAVLGTAPLERARAYGICGIVGKPFDVEELLETVTRCADSGPEPLHGLILPPALLMLLADLLHRH